MRVWSFLRRLFRRDAHKPRPGATPIAAELGGTPGAAHVPAPPVEPPPSPPQPSGAQPAAPLPDVFQAERDGLWTEAAEDDDEDEDDAEDLDEDAFSAEPDPFIHDTAPPVERPDVDVAALRAQARAAALSCEHKVSLSTPAGPGSLAEALNILLEEGRVLAEFVDDPTGEPIILYRPVEPSA